MREQKPMKLEGELANGYRFKIKTKVILRPQEDLDWSRGVIKEFLADKFGLDQGELERYFQARIQVDGGRGEVTGRLEIPHGFQDDNGIKSAHIYLVKADNGEVGFYNEDELAPES